MGSSQRYLCLYVKCVSSLVETPTNANTDECRYANVFYGILITLFHLLGVDYVQQSALNERCRIMIIYSTAKWQKNQNDIGPGQEGGVSYSGLPMHCAKTS